MANRKIDVNKLTFGVEFEVYLPHHLANQVGYYHRGLEVTGLPGWKLESDGSLNTDVPSGYIGAELVSPILMGADGLRQVIKACEWLRAAGAVVVGQGGRVKQCGMHVHVGWNMSTRNSTSGETANLYVGGRNVNGGNPSYIEVETFVPAELERVISAFANAEKALYVSTGTHYRERCAYTKSIKQVYLGSRASHSGLVLANGNSSCDRFHSLNVTNLTSGDKKTLEVRCFAGTIKASKAIAHIRMVLAIVEKGVRQSKKASWDAAKGVRWNRCKSWGPGRGELNRVMYKIGWIKGQLKDNHVYGNVIGEGLPTIAESRDELIRLADRYDAVSQRQQ